ncbi:MAG: hypothetical protein V4710_04755 [Verrucomicrobiota bacterium]
MSDPVFTSNDLLRSIFDPVLKREVQDYAREQGWDKVPPIDLRRIPRERWDDVLAFPLEWPPEVRAYVDGHQGAFSVDEIDSLEETLDRFYEVTPPYTVIIIGKVPSITRL